MLDGTSADSILSEGARIWFSVGLGAAFLISMGYLVLLWREPKIDLGWLGLMFLLVMIFYLIAFSFLVVASVPSISAKIAVAVVDGLVLLGSKLLAPHFLDYLADDGTQIPLSRRGAKVGVDANKASGKKGV